MDNRNRGIGGFGPGLTPMVQRIMIANGVIWLLQLFPATAFITPLGAISVDGMLGGMIWQPFTYMWLHSTQSLMHILFNMFALWMFGGQLEQAWGSRRFLNFYLTCGVGAGFLIFFWNFLVGNPYQTLGASGAIFGVLTAFSLLWPDRRIMLLFPPIPIRAIYFIPLLFVMQLFLGGGNVSHVGHLGGVLVAGVVLRSELGRVLNFRSLRYRWHRYRMKGRLRAVRREEWEKRRQDDDGPTLH
jgi:membrane associated rhomboid family serine protease